MIISVGSSNPAKTGAVRDAFTLVYESRVIRVMQGFSVDSGVPRTPVGDIQCIQGARNRARIVMERRADADFAVGIESGIVLASFGGVKEGWFERTWVVILDKDGKEGIGSGASFPVPDYAVNRIRTGQDGLGSISDAHAGAKGTKTGVGYCGLVTKKVLCRREVTRDAVIAALAQFLVPEFFEGSGIGVGFD